MRSAAQRTRGASPFLNSGLTGDGCLIVDSTLTRDGRFALGLSWVSRCCGGSVDLYRVRWVGRSGPRCSCGVMNHQLVWWAVGCWYGYPPYPT